MIATAALDGVINHTALGTRLRTTATTTDSKALVHSTTQEGSLLVGLAVEESLSPV